MNKKLNLMMLMLVISSTMGGCGKEPSVPADKEAMTSQAAVIETATAISLPLEYREEPGEEEKLIETLDRYKGGEVLLKEELDFTDLDRYFTYKEIDGEMFQRIYGLSFKEDCTTKREELRYLKILHYGFDKEIRVGEIIANEYITEDLIFIFKELFLAEYEIEKILLVDEYGADDDASMADNNSSCFNFRRIAGSGNLSKHSLGLAVDINPLYNPYIRYQDAVQIIEPEGGALYADRANEFFYKIDTEDLCYKLFISRGFIWGGSWNLVKDYQHFEKDMPKG